MGWEEEVTGEGHARVSLFSNVFLKLSDELMDVHFFLIFYFMPYIDTYMTVYLYLYIWNILQKEKS